jgi:hypothetical protein
MRFACLGFLDESRWSALNPSEQQQLIAECIAFDRELHSKGHFAGGFALKGVNEATTVRWSNGAPAQTDGPFAETKELLGGILILEAKDRDEALALMRRHPGIRVGPFEVRPLDEDFMSQHPVLKTQ